MSKPRRTPGLRIAASLAAGAVVTVLVAWGCWLSPWKGPASTWFPIGISTGGGDPETPGRWYPHPGGGLGTDYRRRFIPGTPERWDDSKQILIPGGNWRSELRAHAGLPARALARTNTYSQLSSPLPPPWLPLWPGFAIDTALYGTLACLAWSAPSLIRRGSRRRRGLCPACGYSRSGLPAEAACPECGGMLPACGAAGNPRP